MLALSYASSVSPYFYQVRSTVTTAVKSSMKVRTLGNKIVAAEPGFFFLTRLLPRFFREQLTQPMDIVGGPIFPKIPAKSDFANAHA